MVGKQDPLLSNNLRVKINYMTRGKRIDRILVERGLAEDLESAKRLVMAGRVLSRGELILNPSQMAENSQDITLTKLPEFVSRGGEKLQAVFDLYPVVVEGLICADIGASTGGFTDCLLKHGAKRIYAIDVGYGILDWRLRNDNRVMILERTNARFLTELPEPINLFTADLSFISLRKVLPVACGWFFPAGGEAVVLIKPQFEATREESARGGGVIRDPAIHRRILREVLGEAVQGGYCVNGLIQSPLLGSKGNTEFLTWLGFPADEGVADPSEELIASLF
jgi:23S rRNA (cytidine1920-2'-O)/16S rRNA (cytidine1409-2'-O)-methyltransferase